MVVLLLMAGGGGVSGLELPVLGEMILARVGLGGAASTCVGASVSASTACGIRGSHGGSRFSEFTGRRDLVTTTAAHTHTARSSMIVGARAAVGAPAAPTAVV
ncbi:hypothetical protein F4859DRAFT_482662 [Xylaria cf. heliscus]|nr:hypothetical protein F4859DRAFT_482662 [Xylaria cf. heliscus]